MTTTSPCRRRFHPSPGTPFPDRIQARLIQLPALALAWIFTANQLAAASTVRITNDWVDAYVHLIAPQAGLPTVYDWSDSWQGEAVTNLVIDKNYLYGTSGELMPFAGKALARIGPTVDINYSTPTIGTGYTQLFGSEISADDYFCTAHATIDSIWKLTVSGDAAPFYTRGWVDNGHIMDFTLYDSTTGQIFFSRSISIVGTMNEFGTLEPSHDYLLILHQKTGPGDSPAKFAFGFSNSVQVEFASDRTHLAIPEPSTAGILGTALAGLAMFHRKIVRHRIS